MNPEDVRDAFRSGGDDFEYRDEAVDLGGVASGESSIHIDHFVVKRDARGQGIASTVLSCLEDVMREEGYYVLTLKIQAAEASTRDELDAYEAEQGGPDPTEAFLRRRGFENIQPVETYQWGLCFEAHKRL